MRSSCLLQVQVMPWWHVKVHFHAKPDKSQVSTRWSLTRTSKRQRLLKATGTQSSRNSLALSLFRWGKILSSIFYHRTLSKLNPMGNEVFFEVWDKDRLSKDDLMGKVVALLIWKSILWVGRKKTTATNIANQNDQYYPLETNVAGLYPAEPTTTLSGGFWCLPLSSSFQEVELE